MGSRSDAGGERIYATAVAKDESRGRTILFRYVRSFEPRFDRALFPVRVVMTWPYKSERGMPTQAERERMDGLEDLLTPELERTGFAVLVLVSTGEDLREWTWYARSEDEFLSRLNALLGEEVRFPIEIHVGADEAWHTYDEFVRGVHE